MSQLKLTADGGGGTVAIKAPASTTGNNPFELTVPGTASGTILTDQSSLNSAKLSPAISSDCVTIVTRTVATGVSDLTFSLDFDTYIGFTAYLAIDPIDDGVLARMRVRDGSSDLTSSDYHMRHWGYSGGANDSQDHFKLNISDAGKYGYEGIKTQLDITGVADNSNSTYGIFVKGAEFHATTSNARRVWSWAGVAFGSSITVDGMRIYLDSGNMERVTYSLVGFKL